MVTVSVLAGLAMLQALSITEAERDDDVIVICTLESMTAGQDDAATTSYFLGWQYDRALSGSVPADAVRFADPNNFLAGRVIDEVRSDEASISFFTVDPETRDRRFAAVIQLTEGEGMPPGILTGALGVAVNGNIEMTHLGSCSAAGHRSGANLMFQAMQEQPLTMDDAE